MKQFDCRQIKVETTKLRPILQQFIEIPKCAGIASAPAFLREVVIPHHAIFDVKV